MITTNLSQSQRAEPPALVVRSQVGGLHRRLRRAAGDAHHPL